MKSYFSALAVSALAFSGCNSVHTQPLPPANASGPNSGVGVGIPYRLPAGMVTLDLTLAESGNGTERHIAPSTQLKVAHYPDPGSPLLLLPSHNPLFATHHTISVSNGLLSSVSTTEEGKIKDAVLSLAQTGINLVKLQAAGGVPSFGAQSDADTAAADIFFNGSPHPTDAEIAFALESGLGAKVALTLLNPTPEKSAASFTPIGAAGLLAVKATLDPLPLPASPRPPGAPPTLPAGQEPGLYTRLLKPHLVTVDLVLRADALRRLRLLSHEKARRALEAEHPGLIAERNLRAETLSRRRADQVSVRASLDAMQKRVAALNLELARHDLTDELRKTRSVSRDAAVAAVTALKAEADALLTHVQVAQKSYDQARNDLFKLEQQRTLIAERTKLYLPPGPTGASADSALLVSDLHLRTNVTVVVLPDQDTVVRVPVTRTAFGRTFNTLSFEDGILIKYDSNQPGAVAELFSIPAAVTGSVVDAVAQIFQFRIDLNTKRKDAAVSDVALATALAQMRKDLEALKPAPPAPAPAPLPTSAALPATAPTR